jgi:hypothetical protein
MSDKVKYLLKIKENELMENYMEFEFALPIYDLLGDRLWESFEKLCQILDIFIEEAFLDERHESYFDHCTEKGKIVVFRSKKDMKQFLWIDMYYEPTDQMDTVGIGIKCKNELALEVRNSCKKLIKDSQITTFLKSGNYLNLDSRIDPALFESKLLLDKGGYRQDLEIYEDQKRVYSSEMAISQVLKRQEPRFSCCFSYIFCLLVFFLILRFYSF